MDYTSKYLHRSEAQIDCLIEFFLSYCIGKLGFQENLSLCGPQCPVSGCKEPFTEEKVIFFFFQKTTKTSCVYTHAVT